MRPLFSIVTATYNRAELIAIAIQSVCEQTLAPAEFEMIVVDNNSTDKTCDVVKSFCLQVPNIIYLFEPQLGSSLARNKGCRQARGKYIAFIDDDCKVPPEWLSVAKKIVEEQAPGVFGGPYYAFYTSPKPAWFKDSYGSYEPSNSAGRLENPISLATGNLFVRRDLFTNSSGFSSEYGIMGKKRVYGDETAMLLQIHKSNPDLLFYYEPKLFVYHWVRPEKMNLGWLISDRFTQGRNIHQVIYAANLPKRGRVTLINRLAILSTLLIADWLLLALLRRRTQYPYVQNYWYESSLGYIKRAGTIYQELNEFKNNASEHTQAI